MEMDLTGTHEAGPRELAAIAWQEEPPPDSPRATTEETKDLVGPRVLL